MTHDIYSAPDADLTSVHDEADATTNEYYVVSKKKFLILYLATVGYYEYYWFFKNWQIHKRRTGDNIWPVMRAIFMIFFTHSLFSRVDDTLQRTYARYYWSPGSLATMYVAVRVVSNVIERFSQGKNSSAILDAVDLALVPISCYILSNAQDAINVACHQVDGESNNTFSGANYAWIVVGLILWAAVIASILMD